MSNAFQFESLSRDELLAKLKSAPVPIKDQMKIGLASMGMGLVYLVLDFLGARLSPGSSCAHATMVYVCFGVVLMLMFTQAYSVNVKLAALSELLHRKNEE